MITVVHGSDRWIDQPGAWIYLGDDPRRLISLTKRLGEASRVETAHVLEEVYESERSRWVDWISRQNANRSHDLFWWCLPLAGKNVLQTKFFGMLLWLQVVQRKLTDRFAPRDLLIICDDPYLARSLIRNGRNSWGKIQVSLSSRWLWRGASVLHRCATVARVGRSLFLFLKDVAIARVLRAPKSAKPHAHQKVVLLHTCVDGASISRDSVFSDRYFGSLNEWLSQKGYFVLTLPWVFSGGFAVHKAIRAARPKAGHFLFLTDRISFTDCLISLRGILRAAWTLRLDSGPIGLDVSDLVARERWQALQSGASILPFLCLGRVLGRWLGEGNRCDLWIDMFENAPNERPFVRELRRRSPATVTVGYQHSGGIPRGLPAYAWGPGEFTCEVFPDWVVANSAFSADDLVADGIPQERVRVGPALRYPHLIPEQRTDRTIGTEQKTLFLVLLPMDSNAAAEYLFVLQGMTALLRARGLDVVIKYHPMCCPARILRKLDSHIGTAHWRWVSGSVADYLPLAQIVFGEGSVLLEAAALGIPVICLASAVRLSLNPLTRWKKEFSWSVNYSAHDLIEAGERTLESIWQVGAVERDRLASTILAGIGRLDDQYYVKFLKDGWCPQTPGHQTPKCGST
jgi:surface carbohydrate biosynthesis protein (TIGR04326 family)